MARLIVRLRGQQVGSILLEESKTYVAGRKEDCDIILQAEKGISREHFSLSFANGVWIVELLSKYGVMSQHGAKVSKIELKHGELFAVPPYEFEYTHSKIYQENVRSAAEADADAIGSDKTMVGIAPSVPFIRMLAKNEFGQESILQLQSGDVWIAGRDASCHILINDQRVSRRQFELRRSGQIFQIVDAGSANGTFVNGDRVRSDQAYVLKSGDEISVLDNRIVFELRDPHFQAKIEALPVIERSMVQVNDYDENSIQDESDQQYEDQHENQGVEHGSLPMAVGDHRLSAPYDNSGGGGGLAPYHGQGSQQGFPAIPPSLSAKPARSPLQKIMMLLVGLAAIFYIYTDFVQTPSSQAPVATQKANDPFSKLKPNQQALVKQSYQMAKNLFTSGKYELARNELQKIFEIIPEYEDAKELDRLAKEAVA
ncbi:MAG TPA: FHA domain-containing protein, partial [Pseudobdellovibrionaceae bacterium]|nr:FHA domain-containing protein [Pseudobdellovibrionaceae bacterium]